MPESPKENKRGMDSGTSKKIEERIKKPNKEEDTHDGLLYAKIDGKQQDKSQIKCFKCNKFGHF